MEANERCLPLDSIQICLEFFFSASVWMMHQMSSRFLFAHFKMIWNLVWCSAEVAVLIINFLECSEMYSHRKIVCAFNKMRHLFSEVCFGGFSHFAFAYVISTFGCMSSGLRLLNTHKWKVCYCAAFKTTSI